MPANAVLETSDVRAVSGMTDRGLQVRWDYRENCASASTSSPMPPRLGVKARSSSDLAKLTPIIRRLNELLGLQRNWDSYGADPIKLVSVETALDLLSVVIDYGTPLASIVPTPEGGVQLEWHIRGVDLEIEIDAFGRPHAYFSDGEDDTEWEADLSTNLRPLHMAMSLIRHRR